MKSACAMIVLAGLVPASTGESARRTLEVATPVLPTSVISDGRTLLAFEIHLTNAADAPVDLRAIRILAVDGGSEIAAFTGDALSDRIAVIDRRSESPPARLGAGDRGIVYVEIEPRAGAAPGGLIAEIAFAAPDGIDRTLSAPLRPAGRDDNPVLAPPLKGGAWVAVHDPSWPRGHRRVVRMRDGRASVPGRYAIDWVGVDETGRVSKSDPDRPGDAIGYGAPVLAGADAVVVATRDGMAEAESIAGNPAKALEDGSGNHVVLRLGVDRYAVYEHLRPGSITVRPGDRVRAGQPIAALGFSGDSTGPHLHLHVADCASPISCEGVPFTIAGMTEVGRYVALSDLGTRRWRDETARGRLAPEWPGYNVVVRFPD